jgi:hypothetical protein
VWPLPLAAKNRSRLTTVSFRGALFCPSTSDTKRCSFGVLADEKEAAVLYTSAGARVEAGVSPSSVLTGRAYASVVRALRLPSLLINLLTIKEVRMLPFLGFLCVFIKILWKG